MSLHTFDPKIAEMVGVNAAVIYQNFLFWCEKNKANGRHVIDGYVWTYNSRRAMADLFPYLSDSQIKTAMSKLIDVGLIIKGDYNKANYDRTNWYSPAISAEWVEIPIGQKSPMDWSETANGLAKNRQPIPDSKPDSKPDVLLGADAPKPKKTPKKAVQLPEGWVPNDRNMQDATDRNFSQQEISHEADQFRNYHHAKGTTYKNWDAAWRTWLGNARKFSGGSGRSQSDALASQLSFAATTSFAPGEDIF